jgi:hypothetical protein
MVLFRICRGQRIAAAYFKPSFFAVLLLEPYECRIVVSQLTIPSVIKQLWSFSSRDVELCVCVV